MNNTDKYYREIITKFPDADLETLNNIITQINHSDNPENIYNLIIEILEEIFRAMASKGLNLSLSNLSDEERETLENELDNILSTLHQQGNNLSKEEMVKVLIRSLQRKFIQKHQLKEEEYNKSIPEHVRKNIKSILLRAFIYEFYKFVNPQRIAGETAVENFINNVVYGGLKYALEHKGHEYAQDPAIMSKVSKIVKDVNKGGFGLGR